MKINVYNFGDLEKVVKAKQKSMLCFLVRGVTQRLLVYYDEAKGEYSLPEVSTHTRTTQKTEILEHIKDCLLDKGFKEKESPLLDTINLDLDEDEKYHIADIDNSGIVTFRNKDKDQKGDSPNLSNYARIGKGSILKGTIVEDPKTKYPKFTLGKGKDKVKVVNAFKAMYTFLVENEEGIRYNLKFDPEYKYTIETEFDSKGSGRYVLATSIK